MISSQPSQTEREAGARASLTSTSWIELGAVPIASSIMDAQPIGLSIFTLLLFVYIASATRDTQGHVFSPVALVDARLIISLVTLLLLVLHWSALFIERRGTHEYRTKQLLHLLPLCGALILITLGQFFLQASMIQILFSGLLTLGAWVRGRVYASHDLHERYLLQALKIGFIVMIFIICGLVLDAPLVNTLPEAMVSLAVFFLSSLIALSFCRIALMRQANAVHQHRGEHSDPTQQWLWVISLVGVVFMAVVLVLQGTPLTLLITALVLLVLTGIFFRSLLMRAWQERALLKKRLIILAMIVLLIVALILLSFWLQLAFPGSRGSDQSSHLSTPTVVGHKMQPPPPPPPLQWLTTPSSALSWLFPVILIVLCVACLLLFWWYLKKRRRGAQRYRDERRERIALRDLLQRRRRDEEHQEVELEPLDPASARARYREFLQSLAEHDPTLARRAMETPTEYQRRLQGAVESTRAIQEQAPDLAEADPAVLDELTSSYKQERYGGKRTKPPTSERVTNWISSAVKRLQKTP